MRRPRTMVDRWMVRAGSRQGCGRRLLSVAVGMGMAGVLATGCGSASVEPPPPDTTGAIAPVVAQSIIGVNWLLHTVDGSDESRTRALSAGFALFPDGRYRIDDGANASTGTWTLHPAGIAFTPDRPGDADPVVVGEDPRPRVRAFMSALQQPLTGYDLGMRIADDRLSLTIFRDDTAATFRYDGTAGAS